MNIQLVVIEWMHPGIRQSGKCRVKYGAAPHTWRNDSAELHKHDTAMLWTTMRQQASGTQVCMESEGHIETSFEIHTQFQEEVWCHLY